MADYDLGTAHGKIVVDYKDKGTGQAAKDLDNVKSRARALMDQFSALRARFTRDAQAMGTAAKDVNLGGMSAQVQRESVGIRQQLAAIDFGQLTKKFGDATGTILGHMRDWGAGMASARQRIVDNANAIDNTIQELAQTFGVLSGAVAFTTGMLSRQGMTLAGLKGPTNILRSLALTMGVIPEEAKNFPSVIQRCIQLSAALTLLGGSFGILARSTRQFAVIGTITKGLDQFGGVLNKLGGPIHAVSGAALSLVFTLQQLKFVKQVAKWLGLIGGVGAAAAGAIHLVAGLAQAIQQLSGLIGLAPAAIGPAVLAFGAIKLGVQGFGDAMKATEDPAKFAEAIKKLTPAAREAAIALRDIKEKGLKELQKAVQESLFKNLGKEIQALGKNYLPILKTQLTTVAGDMNRTAREVTGFMNSLQGKNTIASFLGNSAGVLNNLLRAIEPIFAALMKIGEIGSEVLLGLTGGAGAAADKFRDFVYSAEGTAKIKTWILEGIQAFKDLWTIVKNVGTALTTIFSGLNGGEQESFLSKVADMTTKFNEFLKSAEGSRILGLIGSYFDKFAENAKKLGDAFVQYVLPALEKFAPIAQTMSGGLIDGIISGIKVLSPVFIALGTALTPIAPLLGYIFSGMVSFAVVLAGLFVAAKIFTGAIFLLKVGLDTVKTVFAVAGFAARLFTGNLRSGELMVLKFIGTLIKQVVVGVARWIWGHVVMAATTIANVAKIVAAWIVGIARVVAGWVMMGIQAASKAAQIAVIWITETLRYVAAVIAQNLRMAVAVAAHYLRIAAAATLNAIKTAAVWIAQSTLMATQVILQNARMALALGLHYAGIALAATANAIKTAAVWIAQTTLYVAQVIAQNARMALAVGLHYAAIALAATTNAIRVATTWLVQTAITTAGMIASWAVTTATVVAGWVLMGVQSLVNAARMAAAWFIALGPIGWVIAAVIALVALIIANWDTVVAATEAAWNWVMENVINPVKEFTTWVISKISEFINSILTWWNNLVARIRAYMMIFSAVIKAKVDEVIRFFQELPGKVMGFLQSLPGRLADLGRNMVNGLMNGLAALGNRIKDFLMEKATAAWNAVKDFFGVASPSKLMAWLGEMVVDGLANGIADNTKTVVTSALKMSDAVKSAIDKDMISIKGAVNMSYAKDKAAVGNGTKAAIQAIPPGFNQITWGKGKNEATGGQPTTTITGPVSVTIDAKTVAEMKSVSEFFGKVEQTARAGKAT